MITRWLDAPSRRFAWVERLLVPAILAPILAVGTVGYTAHHGPWPEAAVSAAGLILVLVYLAFQVRAFRSERERMKRSDQVLMDQLQTLEAQNRRGAA